MKNTPAWADPTASWLAPLDHGRTLHSPDYCPNCGEAVPEKARVCPACGSDESTGWSEMAESQRLGLPPDQFEDEEFLKQEFGPKARPSSKSKSWSWIWWMVAVGFILILLAKFI